MQKISIKANPNIIFYFQDQERLALAFGSNLHVYNSKTSEIIQILFSHKSDILDIQENAQTLYTIDKSGELCIWKSETLTLIHKQ